MQCTIPELTIFTTCTLIFPKYHQKSYQYHKKEFVWAYWLEDLSFAQQPSSLLSPEQKVMGLEHIFPYMWSGVYIPL